MTHYRMLDRAPSVVITTNRNELKVYQGNIVYLNDGDNFELRFFNPLPYKIGVEINFNGIKKGDSYLVLNPGQDLTLDRFLDEQRKMLFETYTIDGNNEAAVKAIEKNGLISFNFYKEYGSRNLNENIKVNYDFPPRLQKPVYNTYNTTNIYYGSGTSGSSGMSGASGSSGTGGVAGTPGPKGMSGSPIRSGGLGHFTNIGAANQLWEPIYYNSPGVYVNETDESSVTLDSLPFSKDYWFPTSDDGFVEFDPANNNSRIYENILETGRVERGEISNQKLRAVDLQFTPSPFYSISYQIMPYSQMNRTINEIREYCPECGYRIRKSSWKYCPKCGNHLI